MASTSVANAARFPSNKQAENDKNEDNFYMKKIEEYVNSKLELFCRRKEELKKKKSEKDEKSTCVSAKRQRSSTEEDEKKNVKKVAKTAAVFSPAETNEQLEDFIVNEMKGSDLKLVMRKVLFKTDLEKGQNRLNMPFKQLATQDFMTADETIVAGDKTRGLKVRLVGPTLQMFNRPMILTVWDMTSTQNYVLRTNWYKFVHEHKEVLKKGTKIKVWSFRDEDQKLCLAITCAGGDQNDVVKLE